MVNYAVRRLFIAIPMLFGAMSLVFFAMRVLPGDPCIALMGDQATREALQDCVRDLGLNRSVLV
jgi:ABC-type dipeptide/oligopeptide/nickel transport system permease component